MFLATTAFGSPRTSSRQDELMDHVHNYLVSMIRTGQICGDYSYAWHHGRLTAYANLARPDAYKRKYLSQGGRKFLREIEKSFGTPPVWELIEDVEQTRYRTWNSATALYLFAHAFDDTPSVFRMDDGESLPCYLLPLPDETREELHSWKMAYQAHDQVWLGSGELEEPAYRQLTNPQSELAESGRELCRRIEEKTGKATYYYLFRYEHEHEDETQCPCPECGRPWFNQDNVSGNLPFWRFPFQCDSCRLVSHMPVSNDNKSQRD